MCYIIVVCFFFNIFSSTEAMTGNDNPILPPMYEMDHFKSCQSRNDSYCKLILQVVPNNKDNAVWKIMEKIKQNPFLFRRDILHRYKCIPHNLESMWQIKQMITNQENAKLENMSVSVHINDIRCQKFEWIGITTDDQIFLYSILIYITIVIAATFFHIRIHNPKTDSLIKVRKYLLCFSIRRNWNKFLQKNDNPDYNRLRSFQGLKSIGMLMVICGHTLMSLVPISVKNPEVFEDLFIIPIFRMVINFGMHYVQVFFLISSWLLADQLVAKFFGQNSRKLTMNTIINGMVIRYFRLIGPLALVVGFSRTSLYQLFERGPQGGHIHLNYDKCKSNALATLLFVNNHYYSSEQCYFISWYLSADFQLYLAAMILAYIALKYKLKDNQLVHIMLFLFGIDWIYNAFVIYKNNLPVSVGTNPEKSKLEVSLSSYETFALHTSLYINTGGYIVGLVAGVLYNQFKNKNIKYAKTLLKLGLITPFIIFLSIFDYSPTINGIIGSSLNPLYNLGIACMVFGMVFSKENGALKKFLEWEYFEHIAKISYSVYLVHYWICFGSEMLFDDLIELSYTKLVVFYLIEVCLSIALGLVVFIVFECPIRGLLGLSMKKDVKKTNKQS